MCGMPCGCCKCVEAFPGTISGDGTGDGQFTSLADAQADQGDAATIAFGAPGGVSSSEVVTATNFGFSIPKDPKSIILIYDMQDDGFPASINATEQELILPSTTSGYYRSPVTGNHNRMTASCQGTINSPYPAYFFPVLGLEPNETQETLWEQTVTASDVNSSSFGVNVYWEWDPSSGFPYAVASSLQYIKMRVCY